MATTDARAGFRLPWSSDRSSTDETEQLETAEATAEPTTEPAERAPSDGWPTADATTPEATVSTDATEAIAHEEGQPFATETEDMPETAAATRIPSGRKPSKFLADLTKAMQTAAEEARGIALSQLQAEAKSHVEQIHGRSSTEAANLRRQADDDVAAVREWSKAEIARIREETEAKISERKGQLESQIENHAAVIEREIESVQATVAGFEADMAAFFERLLAEEDPTQFATMAENLPEPPSFESFIATVDEPAVADTTDDDVAEAVAEVMEPVDETEAVAEAETTEAETTQGETQTDAEAEAEAQVETLSDPAAEAETGTETEYPADQLIGDTPMGELGSFEGGEGEDGEVDREAAFAAIQAAAEAAASAEVAADAAARAEAVADVAIEIIGSHGEEGETDEEADPRVAALGLSPDYDAAEAEALASADASDGEEIPEIGDDALAARLAGLVPNRGSKPGSGDATATQVIVVGLVSVASIASFKRHLGRLPGVQSVGVSSGPDGEFVFAVNHTADVVLREAIPSMPSFQARVTNAADGVVHVTAHDPESDN
jgi:hypothetical protein